MGVRPAGGETEQDTWRDGDGPRTQERPHEGWAGGQAQDCGRTNGLTGGMQLCGCVGLEWSSRREQTPKERSLFWSHLNQDKNQDQKKVLQNYFGPKLYQRGKIQSKLGEYSK